MRQFPIKGPWHRHLSNKGNGVFLSPKELRWHLHIGHDDPRGARLPWDELRPHHDETHEPTK